MRRWWVVMGLASAGCTDVVLESLRVASDLDADLRVLNLDRVRVNADAGDLTILGTGDGDQVVLDLEIVTDRPIYDGLDDRAVDSLVLEMNAFDGTGAEVSFTMGMDFPRYQIRGSVLLPEGVELDVVNTSGALVIDQVGDLDVDNGDGGLTVTDVAGDATLMDGDGDLMVSGVTGAVRITDGDGDITIEDVGSYEILADGGGAVVAP